MTDVIVIGIIVLIIGAAVTYILKAKKKSVRCIGCAAAGECARKQNGCSCHRDEN